MKGVQPGGKRYMEQCQVGHVNGTDSPHQDKCRTVVGAGLSAESPRCGAEIVNVYEMVTKKEE